MNKKLGLIILCALLLRLPHLNGSFWLDEAAQALEIVRPFSQQFNIVDDFQPPLLHLILHFAQYFSISEWWLRTIGALIPSLLTILFTYKVSEKLFNKKIASIASLFLATSQFHIFYSQELRPYSLATMFALMSMFYFSSFLKDDKNPRLNMLKLSFANLGGIYSTYLFPFFIISQLTLIIMKYKSRLFDYSKTLFIPILLFIPWIPTFLKQLIAGQQVRINLPGWENVVSHTPIKSIPLIILKFIFGNLDIEPNLFFIIFGLLIGLPFLILMLEKFKKLSNKNRDSFYFIVFWLVVPLLSSWLVSFYIPVIRAKRLLFILPAFYIMAAYLYENFIKSGSKIKSALAVTLILTIFTTNLFSTLSYYTNPKLQRENWRELFQKISTDFSPSNTLIIYSFTDQFAPAKWYGRDEFESLSTGKLFINDVEDLANTLKNVVEYENVLVFDYLRDLTDPSRKIEDELINFEFKEVGALDYPNIGFVKIFTKPHLLIGLN